MIPYTKIAESVGLTIEKVCLDDSILIIKYTNNTYSIVEPSHCYEEVILEEDSSPSFAEGRVKIELGIISQEEYDEYWKKEMERSNQKKKEKELKELKELMDKYPEQTRYMTLFPQP